MPPVNPQQTLERLIDGEPLRVVEEAFSGTNPDKPEYSWSASASVRGETIRVEGEIFFRGRKIGWFVRQLVYERGGRRAKHDIIEMEEFDHVDEGVKHRRTRVAYYHYKKAIEFYDRFGFKGVDLDAAGMGPFIWPQLGANLVRLHHKERLCGILKQLDADWLIPEDPGELLATDIALKDPPAAQESLGSAEDEAEDQGLGAGQGGDNGDEDEAPPIGQVALDELGKRAGKLPMTIDLTDKDHRNFLEKRGIVLVGKDHES